MSYEPLPNEYFTSRGVTELTDYNKSLFLKSIIFPVEKGAGVASLFVKIEVHKENPQRLEGILNTLTIVTRKLGLDK